MMTGGGSHNYGKLLSNKLKINIVPTVNEINSNWNKIFN